MVFCVKKHKRDVTLLTKVRIVKPTAFPVVHIQMWELDHKEDWAPKNWWIDAFELWCWRRLLRVPWTARRSNQSILKEINPEYSLQGLMLKLKLQYSGRLMQRTISLEKTDAGKDWRQMEKGVAEDGTVRWHHQLSEHEFEQTPGDSGGQRSLVCCSHEIAKCRTRLREWTTTAVSWVSLHRTWCFFKHHCY